MKTTTKLLAFRRKAGFIALIAVIGFIAAGSLALAGCDWLFEDTPTEQQGTDDPNNPGNNIPGVAGNYLTSGSGMEMARIPAGTFTMGTPEDAPPRAEYEATRLKQHQVTLTKDFYLGRYPVTRRQYAEVMGESAAYDKFYDDYPAYALWFETLIFCNRLSVRDGLTPAYRLYGSTDPDAWDPMPSFGSGDIYTTPWLWPEIVEGSTGYRLPSEAQWEYACRAGTTTRYYTGNSEDDALKAAAWYGANANGIPHEVGLKTPNAWGLYDMLGNTWEWCQDGYNYMFKGGSARTDPLPLRNDDSTSTRIQRGGMNNTAGEYLRSDSRGYSFADYLQMSGFRLARPAGPNDSAAPATPSASPAAGAVPSGATVTLTATAGAEIWYTTDGSAPARNGSGSTRYTGPVPVTKAVTLKAAAVKDGVTGGILKTRYTASVEIETVRINAGTFLMGSPTTEPGRSSDETQHSVTLTQGFYMGKYPVTQEQYAAVMGKTIIEQQVLATKSTVDYGRGDNYPMYFVSWYEAVEFCNRLSVAEGLTPAYEIPATWPSAGSTFKNWTTDPADWGRMSGSQQQIRDFARIVEGSTGWRLPTEAQWEYACRAGTTTAYNTGDTLSDDTGWGYNNSGEKVHEVGLNPPNAWGLYDMHGNVLEWCWDLLGNYPGGAQTDPTGAVLEFNTWVYRMMRGGSWDMYSGDLRSARRYHSSPDGRGANTGFRPVRPL